MCDELNIQIGQRIQAMRKFRAMFQEHLAEKCKWSRQYVSAIEGGRRAASLSQLKLIADQLDCELVINFIAKEYTEDMEKVNGRSATGVHTKHSEST